MQENKRINCSCTGEAWASSMLPEICNPESSLSKELQEFLDIPGYTYALDKDPVTENIVAKIDTITINIKDYSQVKK